MEPQHERAAETNSNIFFSCFYTQVLKEVFLCETVKEKQLFYANAGFPAAVMFCTVLDFGFSVGLDLNCSIVTFQSEKA